MKKTVLNNVAFLWCLGVLALTLSVVVFPAVAAAAVEVKVAPDFLTEGLYDEGEKYDGWEEAEKKIADPLEPWNRAVFVVNDKLYFWVLKPVRIGYSAVLPKDVRVCLGNFFDNLASPVVLINTLLQGRFDDAGTVLSRFGINTVLGVYGLADPAASEFSLNPPSADFGQTLGKYGLGGGVYLYWPLFGPSNIRDSIGRIADTATHPLAYSGLNSAERTGYSGANLVNSLSLSPNDYEEMKKYSLDPYVAIRQGYHEYRNAFIKGKRRDREK
jgi:phospholipid-binding lipoprotein MlaA